MILKCAFPYTSLKKTLYYLSITLGFRAAGAKIFEVFEIYIISDFYIIYNIGDFGRAGGARIGFLYNLL